MCLSAQLPGADYSSQVFANPYVTFVGRHANSTFITSAEAMKGRVVGCLLNADYFCLPVLSFKLTLDKNGKRKTKFSSTNKLTCGQIKLLQNLSSGSRIIFSEVKVRFLDGSTGFIMDGVFIIK